MQNICGSYLSLSLCVCFAFASALRDELVPLISFDKSTVVAAVSGSSKGGWWRGWELETRQQTHTHINHCVKQCRQSEADAEADHKQYINTHATKRR